MTSDSALGPPDVTWKLGLAPDPDALRRMRAAFRRPTAPFLRAWRMHGIDELVVPERRDENDADYFRSLLWEIAQWTASYDGDASYEEWFLHLLPELVERSAESTFMGTLLEPTMTAFFAVYAAGVPEHYEGFAADCRATVGVCACQPPPKAGPFSASVLFWIKYAPPETLDAWLRSAIAIDDPVFHARWIVWLHFALDELEHGRIAQLAASDRVEVLGWEGSHMLTRYFRASEFLPASHIDAFVRGVHREITPEILLHWVTRLGSTDLHATLLGADDGLFMKLFG